MMTTVMTILGLSCLGYLLVVAEPMILLRRYFGFKEEEYEKMSKWLRFFHRLNNCPKCFTFWFALIYTFDPLTAAICAIIAGLIEKIMN